MAEMLLSALLLVLVDSLGVFTIMTYFHYTLLASSTTITLPLKFFSVQFVSSNQFQNQHML